MTDARALGERIEVPGAVVETVHRPASVGELSALLCDFHARREGVLVCGGRTRLGLANPAEKLAAAISLEALAGIDVFEPDEGVVHARAGTPVRALQAAVALEGWELPLDPPGPETTVGGAIASGATGPRAQAFGRVADAVLGLEVVGADGTISKCGGRVVKNVTGYDLAKLYTGSFGSLAVVTGAWLRLRPRPAARVVLSGRVAADDGSFARACAAARGASVRACVWSESPGAEAASLTIELGASPEGIAHDRERLERAFPLVPGDDDAIDRLRDARTRSGNAAPAALRARALSTRLGAMRAGALAAGLAVSIDLGLGVVDASGEAASPGVLAALRTLAEECGGNARIEWRPEAWGGSLDAFGEAPGTRALAAALKHRFDPRRILNPGRFVAGT